MAKEGVGMINDKEAILGIAGILGTIILAIVLTLIFNNSWAWVLAFIPYNVYAFTDWRGRHEPQYRKEMYKTVSFILFLPLLIAITIIISRSNIY